MAVGSVFVMFLYSSRLQFLEFFKPLCNREPLFSRTSTHDGAHRGLGGKGFMYSKFELMDKMLGRHGFTAMQW